MVALVFKSQHSEGRRTGTSLNSRPHWFTDSSKTTKNTEKPCLQKLKEQTKMLNLKNNQTKKYTLGIEHTGLLGYY